MLLCLLLWQYTNIILFFYLNVEIGRRSTLTEADLRVDTSRLAIEADPDLTETRALQLTGAARRVSAERIRDRDSESASTKRKRLKRARLNHSDSSGQSSNISTDYYILDGPVRSQSLHQSGGHSPRRTLSQDNYRQLSLDYSPQRRGSARNYQSFDSGGGKALSMDNRTMSMPLDSRLSPTRQPMVYEPRVIVSSGRPVMGEVVMRRSSSRSRHRRTQAQSSVDYDTLVQPCHSIAGELTTTYTHTRNSSAF